MFPYTTPIGFGRKCVYVFRCATTDLARGGNKCFDFGFAGLWRFTIPSHPFFFLLLLSLLVISFTLYVSNCSYTLEFDYTFKTSFVPEPSTFSNTHTRGKKKFQESENARTIRPKLDTYTHKFQWIPIKSIFFSHNFVAMATEPCTQFNLTEIYEAKSFTEAVFRFFALMCPCLVWWIEFLL